MTVMLAIPTRGQMDPAIVAAHANLGAAVGAPPRYKTGHLSSSLVRNLIAREFLADDENDVLLFVDDDVVPSDRVPLLVDHVRRDAWDIVAAAVPIFKPEAWPTPTFAAYEHVGPGWKIVPPLPLAGAVTPCDAVGFGCVAVNRRVFMDMPEPWFGEEIQQDGWLSDDFVFCRAARALTFRIGVDYSVTCDHHVRISLGALIQGLTRAGVR